MMLIIVDLLLIKKCTKDKENSFGLLDLIDMNIEIMKNVKIGLDRINLSKSILKNFQFGSDGELLLET